LPRFNPLSISLLEPDTAMMKQAKKGVGFDIDRFFNEALENLIINFILVCEVW